MGYTLLHNGTLVDGRGGEPITEGAILVHDKQIKAVGRKADIPLPDSDITMLDAQGGTILPGLIDSHVHIMFAGFNFQKIMNDPFSYKFYDVIPYMRATLDCGVTTVRDAGGADLGLKMAVADGLVAGPRLHISICMLSPTGGHADGLMPSGGNLNWFAPYPGRPDFICDGVDGVRTKVRELVRAGADVIKICATGGVSSPSDHPLDEAYSQAELDAFVDEARRLRDRKVMVHAQGTAGIKNALRAGVHSIEHGTLIDDEGIELMLKNGTFLVPTMVLGHYSRHIAPPDRTMPPWVESVLPEFMAMRGDNLQRAYKAGVKIAMGTDSGVIPHGYNSLELGVMCEQLGMSPMEAIMAATKVASECLELQDDIGTLEAGKLGDIIVTSVDPLQDIWGLGQPENVPLVMKEGQVMKNQL